MKQVKPIKLAVLILADIIIIALSLYLSLYMRFLGQVPAIFVQNLNSILIPAIFINLFTFYMLGLYQKKWFHSGFLGLTKLAIIVLLGLLLTYLYSLYSVLLPRSIFLISFIMLVILIGGSRLSLELILWPVVVNTKNGLKEKIVYYISSYFIITVKLIIDIYMRLLAFTRVHKELTLLIFLTFLMRLLLAGWNSYWYDELCSVFRLMLLATPEPVKIQSAYELISHYYVAGRDYPLYDFLLYTWMQVFGTSEVATRALSSIYVTLATVFLYLTVNLLYNRRIALCAALFFNLSYMAMYYSLEARFYGQTLFLSTLSSYFLVLYLESIETKINWKTLIINKNYAILLLVNFAFLLTFTFNFLFFAAQGIFVLVYFLYKDYTGSKLKSFYHVIAIYAIQILVMFVLWFHSGIRGIFSKYDRFGGINDEVSQAFFNSFKSPLLIFYENVVKPNFSLPLAIMLIILLFFSITFIKQIIKLYKKDINTITIRRALYFIYFLLLTVLPSLLIYLIFSIGGFEKLVPRYLIYSVPSMMILLALSLEQFVITIDKVLRLFKTKAFLRHYINNATIYIIIVTIILILPGSYNAASRRKDDWRGIANQIVQQIHQNPDSSYYVVETTHRSFPMMDFYFNQYSKKVQVSGIIRSSEERRVISDESYIPNILSSASIRDIEEHDYFIIAFAHAPLSAKKFPKIVELISDRYDLIYSNLDARGRGYMIFSTH